jgi:hypothetical protein
LLSCTGVRAIRRRFCRAQGAKATEANENRGGEGFRVAKARQARRGVIESRRVLKVAVVGQKRKVQTAGQKRLLQLEGLSHREVEKLSRVLRLRMMQAIATCSEQGKLILGVLRIETLRGVLKTIEPHSRKESHDGNGQ